MSDASRMILGPIVGGLSATHANLWARADRPGILYAWLATRKDLSDAKRKGFTPLGQATGFAGIVSIDKLQANTKYYYTLTLDPKVKPSKSSFHTFTTFPNPGSQRSFRFAFGSCFRPGKTNPGRIFQHIHQHHPDISFLMMLGDQIYADEWNFNGLGRVASNLEDYRAVYLHTWSNIHHRTLLANTPVFMTLDDHEVDNDWCWKDFHYQRAGIPLYTRLDRLLRGRAFDERNLTLQRVRAALQANWEHQMMHAPQLLRPNGPLAYSFEFGSAAFFVLDTRTRRVWGSEGRAMLDMTQWRALTKWLQSVKKTHPVKFIITSIAFLSQIYGDATNDRWSGWKPERDRLLYLLAAENVEGVYFLSGDLHSAHAISADIQGADGKILPIREFCSSPFEQICNPYAWLLDHPARSQALRNQKMHFIVSEINYGIVSVDFNRSDKPKVTFELNYLKGDRWLTIKY